jgi:hypothetical protein
MVLPDWSWCWYWMTLERPEDLVLRIHPTEPWTTLSPCVDDRTADFTKLTWQGGIRKMWSAPTLISVVGRRCFVSVNMCGGTMAACQHWQLLPGVGGAGWRATCNGVSIPFGKYRRNTVPEPDGSVERWLAGGLSTAWATWRNTARLAAF